jgi:outer membrane receptor protein involved in Fe transport
MKKAFMFVLALSLALLAANALAQTTTTGSIEGLITDPNGAIVKGATVTATSPNLITPQTATTGDNGRYQILNLPPGMYKVTVDAGGFAKYTSNDFSVNLGRTSTADATLQLGTSTNVVNVVGGAAVDVAQNTTGNNVSTEQFSNFPTQRTVQGLYTIAPTVTRSGLRDATGRDRDPSVGGSSGPENNYILDGVNTTDPAMGGSGANLPFEFVQEVEIKTGAFGAEYGKATGGIFNVITKSGGNEFHGDLYGYGTTKGLVRAVKNFPFTGSAANGFSEADIGGDIGGPVKKDKIWFFGAFNPQRRRNFYLTQTFFNSVNNKVTIPFYAGKITWALNSKNTLTGSTFGDFTKVQGFLATAALNNVSGFGNDINAYTGTQETGGHNYTGRLNSTIRTNFIAEISGALHFQRNNTIPTSTTSPLITDNFAVLKGASVLMPVSTGVNFAGSTGFIDFVDGRGGSLQRNYTRGPGFGLFGNQKRNRYEINAHMQNIKGEHTVKWGFEWNRNVYDIQTLSTGPAVTYANPLGVPTVNLPQGAVATNGVRITNNWLVCTTRSNVITCPTAAGISRAQAIPAATLTALGLTVNPTATTISTAEAFGNPFLLRNTTRVRDFELKANSWTSTEAFYLQDDYKFARDWQFSFGARWDYQQAYNADGTSYVRFNNFWDNLAPRIGLTWDFTGKGKGKLYANYATYIETPIPLDVNVRAAGGGSQTDKQFNVNTINAPATATIVTGFTPVNLGNSATPIDPGLKPQSIGEYTAGIEYEVHKDIALGVRGIYRHMRNVVEDGSFNDGNDYFLFNPGRNEPGTTEQKACNGTVDPDGTVHPPRCFGRAQRFYRAFEVTATKRFSNHYQFITSYVFSSLTGNYEGLFRNDNGQSDPNITSLFDLQSLLDNTYGRLPNDRPHQFKFNGSYETKFKLMLSGNFYVQSGTPFNQLIPHPVYGNNEGFAIQRGTAIVPSVTASNPGFPNTVESIGTKRTPTTMNLDLGFYYPIHLGEKKELRFTGDWFNVFNSQRGVTLDQTYSINSGVAGVPPVVNPFWGSALLIQPPSSFRFGAKFTF